MKDYIKLMREDDKLTVEDVMKDIVKTTTSDFVRSKANLILSKIERVITSQHRKI